MSKVNAVRGLYAATLRVPGQSPRPVFDGFQPNQFLERGSVFLSMLAAGRDFPAIATLALGDGFGLSSGYTAGSPKPPAADDTGLESEIARRAVDASFYDLDGNSPTTIVLAHAEIVMTNKLLLTAVFPVSPALPQIAEAALFGGFASEQATGGIPICRSTFPAFDKALGEELTWTWLLEF